MHYVPIKNQPYKSNLDSVFAGVEEDYGDEEHGGAHDYILINSLGFKDGKTNYFDYHSLDKDVDEISQTIKFVKKSEDGTIRPGVTSLQLLAVSLNSLQKMNEKYPSTETEKAIMYIKGAIEWLKYRIDNRIDRGVMGKLEK